LLDLSEALKYAFMTNQKTALLSTRSVIALKGDETHAFLQSVVSQNVDGMIENELRFSTLLTPQGKILFDFFILKIPDGYLLDCHAAMASTLMKRLKLYKLRAKISIELADDLNVFTHWDTPNQNTTLSDPRHIALGYRSIGRSDQFLPNANEEKYDIHRISLGVPQFGDEFGGEERFLLDVNYDALNGVDYKKGCFVGQEVTSRMKRKGEIRKRTVIVHFNEGIPDITTGADIKTDNSVLGTLLAGASSNKTVLAVIRTDRLKKAQLENASFAVNGSEVTISVPSYLDAD